MSIFQHISKRIFLILAGLLCVSLVLIIFAVSPRPAKKIATTPLPTPTPYQQTQLSLMLLPTIPQSVALAIDTNNAVTVVQAEIGFDPKVLQNIVVTPGTFFANPVVLLNDISYQTGRISYAIAIKPHARGVHGVGTVATITYTVIPGTTTTSTQLTFLPKTLATAENILPSVLSTVASVTIPIKK